MSDIAAERSTVDHATDDDDLLHLECCVDERLSICGVSLVGGTPLSEGDGLCCAVCEDLWNGDSCPVRGRCIDGYGIPPT